jgi:hypothetical protein
MELASRLRRARRATILAGAAATLAAVLSTAGCASRPARFSGAPVVTTLPDRQPIPVPERWNLETREFIARELVRRPFVTDLAVSAPPRAGDVNSRDEVAASTWWTPRLGYSGLTPEELLRGDPAHFLGPPEPPLTVTGAKRSGSDPGFLVRDARGHKYLVKFDPPDRPDLSTTTALIVNRLFWGFGYNVADDSRFLLRREDLVLSADADLDESGLEEVLARAAGSAETGWAATASRWISGRVLGPSRCRGTREDDPNDRIPVERRRSMRAMRVFCSWLNQTGIRPDQTIDTYVGEPGEGWVEHYLVDFGEAFGGHAVTHDVVYLWDGYERFIDFPAIAANLVTLGLRVHPWERLEPTPWPSVGYFEAAIFDPAKWREVYPYEPIRSSRPEDDYWAAKIVGAVTPDHLTALFRAAGYSDPEAAAYVQKTLEERRRKVLEYFLYRVSPLDPARCERGLLLLRDVGSALCDRGDVTGEVEIRWRDVEGHELAPPVAVRSEGNEVRVPLPADLLAAAGSYLRVDARVRLAGSDDPPPAQIHLRIADGEPRLAGVLH